MENYKAYEYKDLAKNIQEKVKEEYTREEIDFQLSVIWRDVEKKEITEEEAYKTIGCSKYYAESTSWFVPSVYYEHHKKEIDNNVEESLKIAIFTKYEKSI